MRPDYLYIEYIRSIVKTCKFYRVIYLYITFLTLSRISLSGRMVYIPVLNLNLPPLGANKTTAPQSVRTRFLSCYIYTCRKQEKRNQPRKPFKP